MGAPDSGVRTAMTDWSIRRWGAERWRSRLILILSAGYLVCLGTWSVSVLGDRDDKSAGPSGASVAAKLTEASPGDAQPEHDGDALEGRTVEGYSEEHTIHDFSEGATYRIVAAPLMVTTLELQPGERVIDPIVAGDAIRWQFRSLPYGTGRLARYKVFVRPRTSEIETSAVITTNRRTYYLWLRAQESPDFMVSVRWRYPATGK
jgi:hypothetical protein